MRNMLKLVVAAALLTMGGCAMDGDGRADAMPKQGDAVMADREMQGLPEPVAPRPGSSLGMLEILAMPHRSEANRARDVYRNPQQTLVFFDVLPHQTVIEVFDPTSGSNERAREYYTRSNAEYRAKLAAAPYLYDRVRVIESPINAPVLGAPASVDRVVTFRNVHNWTAAGTDAAMFKAFFDVLKPHGVLGVEEHRAAAGTDPAVSAKSGYIAESYVIKLATDAGFELTERSEINANPKDTRDYKNGVWTLPPVLRVPEGEDKAKYLAIGESDRMTLKFVKPAR